MTLSEQATAVIAFYKQLTEGGLTDDAAAVCAIDFNKSLMTGTVKPPAPTKSETNHTIAEAADEKRARRAEMLDNGGPR